MLSGIVQTKKKQAVMLGIGPLVMELLVADESHFSDNQTLSLFTYLHWNQEHGPTLYGFKQELDRSIFLLVISCSGIGPRIGLAVLADLGAVGFIEAVRMNDDKMLSKVNGIGIKKAEKMIVHLRHKINEFEMNNATESKSSIDWHTISQALEALNYSRGEIANAIAFIRNQKPNDPSSFDQLLRQALSFLSKQP